MIDSRSAVVLSGGGAYGAFEVGVLKALCSGKSPANGYQPFNPHIFTGTSVGSFNASVMCMEPGSGSPSSAQRLEEIWLTRIADRGPRSDGNGVFRMRGNPLRYLDLSLEAPARAMVETTQDFAYFTQDWFRRIATFATTQGNLPHRALGFIDLSAFVSVEPFRQLLKETLDFDGIRACEKLLRIVVTNWSTGEAKTFGNADMTADHGLAIVMGSSAIPGIFPPVPIGTDTYVDGGVVMNTPLSCALDAGASELHVIYLDPDVSCIPVGQTSNTIDTFSRMYAIMLATAINEDIMTAKWINRGLEILEKAEAGIDLTPADDRNIIRVAGQILDRSRSGTPYKKLTIHKYNPTEDLGGLLGMLDFSEETILSLIDKGFKSGVQHRCWEHGCLVT